LKLCIVGIRRSRREIDVDHCRANCGGHFLFERSALCRLVDLLGRADHVRFEVTADKQFSLLGVPDFFCK
jgi:hypothetical protein